MKFETVILRGLFVASMLVSGLILATMLTSRAAPMNLPIVDGMICTRASI
jgi:hypothetical protein